MTITNNGAAAKCPKCKGTGIESYQDHGAAQFGEAAIEPIKCSTCDGFGTAAATQATSGEAAAKAKCNVCEGECKVCALDILRDEQRDTTPAPAAPAATSVAGAGEIISDEKAAELLVQMREHMLAWGEAQGDDHRVLDIEDDEEVGFPAFAGECLRFLAPRLAAAQAPAAGERENKKLAKILFGMCEGAGEDSNTDIYADGFQTGDGDTYVYRAAEVLVEQDAEIEMLIATINLLSDKLAAAQAPAAKAEPVAYMVSVEGEPELGFWFAEEPGGEGYITQPLYTAPAAQADDVEREK